MSIALDTNRRIVPSVFPQAGLPPYCSALSMAAIGPVVGRDDAVGVAMAPTTATAQEFDRCSSSNSSSSSIGKNSDLSIRSSDDDEAEENEAESSYKEPLEMESLEKVLPIRRGISNFYDGKSKSFTNLVDASSAATINDISKPENAYSRKRRNLLASNLIWDKNRTSGISKRTISTSRSSLAMAVAMSNAEETHITEDLNSKFLQSRVSSVLSRCKYPTWRSYSLADLHYKHNR